MRLSVVVVALEVIHDRVFLGGEAPDVARIGDGVDLIDSPVVGRAEVQRAGGEGVIGHGLGRGGAIGHGVRVGAEEHLVRARLAAGPPSQGGIHADARGGGRRLRRPGLDGHVGEPDFAQAGRGAHAAPGAVDRQLDVLGHDPAEVDGGVGGVARHTGGLGELRHVGQRRPGGAVGRVFDLDVLGAEAEEGLDQSGWSSRPSDRTACRPCRTGTESSSAGRPCSATSWSRRCRADRSVEAGAVDGLLRAHAGLRAGGRGRDTS